MGGKKPDPPSPEIVMQKPTAPTLFRTVVPEESYQDVANYAGRLNQQLRSALQEQYRQAGTSAEIGARQRGIEMQEAADIASSMPTGRDPGFMGVALDKDGGVDNAATAKMTGQGGLKVLVSIHKLRKQLIYVWLMQKKPIRKLKHVLAKKIIYLKQIKNSLGQKIKALYSTLLTLLTLKRQKAERAKIKMGAKKNSAVKI